MKNFIFLLLFGLTLSIATPVSSQEVTNLPVQEQVQQPTTEQVPILTKIWDTIKSFGVGEMIVSFVLGLFAKNGITKVIKSISGKAAVVLKETGDTFIGGTNFSSVVHKAIKEDGTIEQNSIAEAIKAGKEVIAEANDVILSIKPKPSAIKPL